MGGGGVRWGVEGRRGVFTKMADLLADCLGVHSAGVLAGTHSAVCFCTILSFTHLAATPTDSRYCSRARARTHTHTHTHTHAHARTHAHAHAHTHTHTRTERERELKKHTHKKQ